LYSKFIINGDFLQVAKGSVFSALAYLVLLLIVLVMYKSSLRAVNNECTEVARVLLLGRIYLAAL